jgi:hypothetical protein
MRVPSSDVAEQFLQEAQRMNPGAWVDHSKVAAHCARQIAIQCDDLDSEVSYVLALLHDIGRRAGKSDMKHILDGYQFMMDQGYEDSARICLTHSFPSHVVDAYSGENECTAKETEFIKEFLNNTVYDDYDKLIQLCDALAFPSGPTFIEKRLIDVAMRRGFNEYTLDKWKAFFEIKNYFDKKAGCDIYTLISIESR